VLNGKNIDAKTAVIERFGIGIVLVAGDLHTNPIIGIILWLIAIGLFLTGHKIEGNLRAMTLIILFKYLKSRQEILTSHVR
jgi:hypothetical protein